MNITLSLYLAVPYLLNTLLYSHSSTLIRQFLWETSPEQPNWGLPLNTHYFLPSMWLSIYPCVDLLLTDVEFGPDDKWEPQKCGLLSPFFLLWLCHDWEEPHAFRYCRPNTQALLKPSFLEYCPQPSMGLAEFTKSMGLGSQCVLGSWG